MAVPVAAAEAVCCCRCLLLDVGCWSSVVCCVSFVSLWFVISCLLFVCLFVVSLFLCLLFQCWFNVV